MFEAEKFNANDILCRLKDFQKRSAHNAFNRLYRDKDSTSRFLIADEVGLGKTVICRGLIALAIEEIAKTKDFKQGRNNIDIIYICSNQDIASQNIRKLNFVNEDESFASRITLIPEIYSQKELGRVRFVSFTPDTSFNVRRGTGVRRERALLYYFLHDSWDMKSTRAKSLYFFRGGAGGSRWEQFVQKNCEYWDSMDLSEFALGFQKALLEYPHLKEQFLKLRESYPQYNSSPPREVKSETNKVIGELRKILAQVCLHKMSPDLVIMDEFQRFKDLFDENTDVGELAKYLFNYPDVKIVLLSATPYKMYTIGDEDEENHYDDFLSTTSWLLNEDQELMDKLKTNLEKFRSAVFTKSGVNIEEAIKGKSCTEEVLRRIMSRTERVKSTKENDGMIRNNELQIIPTPEEMTSFVQLEEIASVLGLKGNVDYWKSSPYLLNLMENYDIKRRLLDRLHTSPVQKIMAKYPSAFIDKKALEDFNYISPNNSRLKAIKKSIFENDSWKLLWIPPTAPYYKLRGVFEKFADKSFTKSLVFSSWKVVPRAVASLISHEAESKAYLNGPYNDKGVDTYKKRRLLTIGKERDELKGLRTLILLYPSLSLVEFGDIFTLEFDPNSDVEKILNSVKDKIQPHLGSLIDKYKKKEDRDENWYWAAPLLLDRESEHKDIVASWFHGKFGCGWYENDSQDVTQNVFAEHVDRYKQVFYGDIELGTPPDDLLEKLAVIALASPANVIYRSFLNIHKDKTSLDELNKLVLFVSFFWLCFFNEITL